MIEFNPELEHDPELDRPAAKNIKDYAANLKRMYQALYRVWAELVSKKGKSFVLLMLIPLFVICLIGVLTPIAIKTIFDGVLESINKADGFNSQITKGVLFLAGLFVLSEIAQLLKRSVREYIFDENSRSLRQTTNTKFFEKSLGEHITQNRLLNESSVKKGYERVEAFEKVMLFHGIENTTNVCLAYLAIWYLGWFLGLIATAMLLIFLAWSLFLNNKVMEVCLPLDKYWNFLSRYQSERWRFVQRVKSNAKEEEEIRNINAFYEKTIEKDLKFWLWVIRQISWRAIANHLILVGVVIFGVLQVIAKSITLGALYPIINYTQKITDGLYQLSDLEHEINYWSPSIITFQRALDKPKKLPSPENPVVLDKNSPCLVEFLDVGYQFPPRTELGDISLPALHRITFSIKPGKKVALIGQSGAGKTTLMQLLLRFMDPTSGKILIDGFDLRDVKTESWMKLVGYIPQEAQVFSGTFRSNLLYGLSDEEAAKISDSELWEVVRNLQLDLGTRLTNGLDTELGHYGIDLSGGQKQRLMIGAAAFKKPRFMVIDEATSSLDATTEKLVQSGLETVLGPSVGALIVTHRLPTVRKLCDEFVMIDTVNGHGGEVIAIGESFEELADKTDRFRKLAADQDIVL
ncbi:MAG TPA: ABC transporter ATP-binding protein [Candidatus Paceibacterota bacterium]